MFKCRECGSAFYEPRNISSEIFYGVADLFDYYCGEKVMLCPYCDSTDFDFLENVEDEEEDED